MIADSAVYDIIDGTNEQPTKLKGGANMAELKIFKPKGCKSDKGRLLVASSASDLLQYIDANHTWPQGMASRGHEDEEEWDYCAGWSGTEDMIKNGWHTGTDDVLARLEDVKHSLQEEFAGYRMDVTGQFFDVGLVVSGEPECWFTEETQPIRKVCRIQVNTISSWNTPAEVCKNRGAAIVALADHMQQSGWIVEISVYMVAIHHSNKDDNNLSIIRVDVDTKPVDIDALSFLVAHPAGYRRLGFAALEAINGSNSLGGYGGGSLSVRDFTSQGRGDLTEKQANDFFSLCTDGAVAADADINMLEYVTKQDEDKFGTPELAACWVKAQIEAVG